MFRAILPMSGLLGITVVGCTLVAGIADYEKVPYVEGTDASDGDSGERKSRYVDEVLADSPIGYWRLDDAPGKGALDRTGKNPSGNYVAVTLGVPGALTDDSNSAASFDGRNGLLSLGDRFDFSGMTPFSIELWADPVAYDNDDALLWTKGWSDGSGKAQGHYLYLHRGGIGYVRNRDGAGEGIGASAPRAGSYSHVVVTFDGTTMVLYVNGVAQESKTSTLSLIDNPRSFDVGQLFPGAIDELAIYGDVLLPGRVARHYEVGTSP